MRALSDLVCWILGHHLPPGVTRARSIAFMCARCNCVVRGDFVPRRRA